MCAWKNCPCQSQPSDSAANGCYLGGLDLLAVKGSLPADIAATVKFNSLKDRFFFDVSIILRVDNHNERNGDLL